MKNKKFIISILLIAVVFLCVLAGKVSAVDVTVKDNASEENEVETLQAAFTKVKDEGGKITLEKNIENQEKIDDINLSDGKVITLDLNGHNITSKDDALRFISLRKGSLVITGKGVIENNNEGTTNGVISVYGSETKVEGIYTSLVIDENVTVKGVYPVYIGYAGDGKNYGTVVDISGDLHNDIGNDGAALSTNGGLKEGNAKINIYSTADLTSDNGVGIFQPGAMDTVVTGARITGKSGIVIKSGSLSLEDAEVTGNGEYTEPTPSENGYNATGAAIQIESNGAYTGEVELKINGGTYTSTSNAAIQEYGETTKVTGLKITDGEFKAAADKSTIDLSESLKEDEHGQGFVEGGTFTPAIDEKSDYLPKGAIVKDGEVLAKATVKALDDMTFSEEEENGDITITFDQNEITRNWADANEERDRSGWWLGFTLVTPYESVEGASYTSDTGATQELKDTFYDREKEIDFYVFIDNNIINSAESNIITLGTYTFTWKDGNTQTITVKADKSKITLSTTPEEGQGDIKKIVTVKVNGKEFTLAEGKALKDLTDAEQKVLAKAVEKAGYEFIGYQKDGVAFDESTPINENIELVPQYRKILVDADVTGIENKTYTGSELKQNIVVKDGETVLKEGTDYEVVYETNINVGTAKVTIKGLGNYTGTVTKTFTIAPKSIAKATVSGIKDKTYTGKNLTQSVKVVLDGVELKAGTDYEVTYKDQKNPGTATVTITGKGNYEGTVSKNFTISLKKVTVSAKTQSTTSITVKWGTSTGATGYEVYYATSKNGKYTKLKTGNIKEYKKTKLKTAKTYYFKVRPYVTISGKKKYGSYSSVFATSTKTKTPSITVKQSKTGTATISWKKISGATGYEVYMATSKNGKYTKIKTTSSLKYTKKSLKLGKTYYFKVKAYRTVSGKKVYSSYSKVKSTKVKYVVKKGDNLTKIAKAYKTTVKKLVKLNKLKRPNFIIPGLKLIIK